MLINGQCHCGKIEFEGTVDEANVMVCHCVDCLVFSGKTLTEPVVFCKGQDFIIKGKGRAKEYIKTTAESGNKRIQAFCGECGSQLYGCDLDRSGYNVRIGCLDQRDSLSPVKHIFVTSAQKWVNNLDGCPWFKRGSNSETM